MIARALSPGAGRACALDAIVAAVLAVALFLPGAGARADPAQTATGTIRNFECADNCYLTIRTKTGLTTALCEATACRPWFENQKIPQKLIGRRVAVTIGVGKQVNGNYEVVGTFPAFKTLTFVK